MKKLTLAALLVWAVPAVADINVNVRGANDFERTCLISRENGLVHLYATGTTRGSSVHVGARLVEETMAGAHFYITVSCIDEDGVIITLVEHMPVDVLYGEDRIVTCPGLEDQEHSITLRVERI